MAVANIGRLILTFVSLVVSVESKYVELNKDLVPRDISNIQIDDSGNAQCTSHFGGQKARYEKKSSGVLIPEYILLLGEEKLEKVIGTDAPNVYFDEDWGLFSSVLASYNNHWALSTGPEDWWTVVLRNVAQAVANYGDIPAVRDLFVAHQGKKEINIKVGPRLSAIDYSWLFNQFSDAIRKSLKTENYVRTVESDFSTTTSDLKIISQVMLMSSLKNYFSYGISTSCGIPGLHMKGTPEDWAKLIKKFLEMEEILKPVAEELRLKQWFDDTKLVFKNLNRSFNEDAIDQEITKWWSRILSWNSEHGCGTHPHWEGWFPKFLGAKSRQPFQADDFPSGLVYTTVKISDGPVNDTGIFVAGTLGFAIRAERNGPPIVEPNQIWNLLLPEGSPITPRLLGQAPRNEVSEDPVSLPDNGAPLVGLDTPAAAAAVFPNWVQLCLFLVSILGLLLSKRKYLHTCKFGLYKRLRTFCSAKSTATTPDTCL